MAPKPRNKENKHLPARWRFKHGAYYYRVPPDQKHQWDGKSDFLLGRSLADAYQVWGERVGREGTIHTMADLMDRYMAEHVLTKAHKSQESNTISIRKLRPVFGQMRPQAIEPRHAYQYYDIASKKHGKTAARHDIQCLRHMLTKAVEWGAMNANPLIKQVRIEKPPPRDRLVEDWELEAALAVAHPLIALYIPLKYKTGLRRGDILSLRLGDLKEDGIHVQPSKTRKSSGKRLIIEWDDELRDLVERIKRRPPRRIGDAPLFVTRQGKPYIDEKGRCNAFDSLWQRFMDKVMARTAVTERFQERDLRAKTASDSDTVEEASELLAHSSTDITRRVYRRKPVRVKPLLLRGIASKRGGQDA